ncbi:putative pancreatic lipase-related protein 2 isoform X1 [Apostichopus japonicus]|uniref:Putative pancreatic lipase-related protein 2 isoform X1 n=1 Tax=Stichopus japonicus TaxID=307972 RepID=A0A2G8LP59_STIJA|nr:putative pancreatic lipase-related protein 2 isoform X1 [Apostichopus japonicus]
MIAFLILAIVAASANGATKYYNGFSLNNNLECHQLAWPPMSEAEIGTVFYMYTPSNPQGVIVESGDMNTINAKGFNSNKKTHFFTHGYISNSQHSSTIAIYEGWVDVEDANVFAVDWRNGAAVANYNYARQNIRVVGNQIAIFAEALGQSFSKIEFSGHSLGSHASGYAGEALKNKGHTVSRITGLDPAGPGFSSQSDSRCRLDPSDADFVDNIHTDDDTYGTSTDMGHVDFYPNGGSTQPNCLTDIASCSHGRAVDLYAESVRATSCKFTSYACSSWADYDAGQCTGCGGVFGCCNYMGYWATASCTGKRYLKTNGKSQYCIS